MIRELKRVCDIQRALIGLKILGKTLRGFLGRLH